MVDTGRAGGHRGTGMSGRAAPRLRVLTDRDRRTMAAWERFVGGADDVQGVAPDILRSWYRCRDVHDVDPGLRCPPRAGDQGEGSPSLLHTGVVAQLGGIAAGIVARREDCLATVTDGAGRILAAWGTGPTRHRAADSDLAPFFLWSEAATGTNGMGTALAQRGVAVVRGPEHWCASLHRWSCTGVAVHDLTLREPVATLNVSCWDEPVPITGRDLGDAVQDVQAGLHARALRDAAELADAFAEANRRSHGLLVAVDRAGHVVAANGAARAVIDDLPEAPVLDPAARCPMYGAELREIVCGAVASARSEPQWVGSTELAVLSGGDRRLVDVCPVRSPDGIIGLLLSGGRCPGGERMVRVPEPRRPPGPSHRVIGVRDDTLILLSPAEICFAEADRHDVWLVTDHGRIRAATRGLDNVERELGPSGFVRVHRSYLVNLGRIREVDHQLKRVVTVSCHSREREVVPVARRYAAQLRQLLGL